MKHDSVAIAEQYLDEMLEAEANSDHSAYVKRFEEQDLEDFGESTFRKEMFAIREELGQYTSREYLGSMKGNVNADCPDRYPDRIRHVWRGRFEKNDVIIAICLHERDGTFYVSENMYY